MPKTILHIDNCPDVVLGDKTVKEKDLINSCRLCKEGRGIYKVNDTDKKEAFYLCEKHKACYDEEVQDLTPETKKAIAKDEISIAAQEEAQAAPDIFTEAAAKDIAVKAGGLKVG